MSKSRISSVVSLQHNVGAYPVARDSRRALLYCRFEAVAYVPRRSFSRRVTRIQLTLSASLRSTRGRARITPRHAHCERGYIYIRTFISSLSNGWCAPVTAQRARSWGTVFLFCMLSPSVLSPLLPKGQIASILVSSAPKPQLPKTRQLNGTRRDETYRTCVRMHVRRYAFYTLSNCEYAQYIERKFYIVPEESVENDTGHLPFEIPNFSLIFASCVSEINKWHM